jgi:hypothetical protein
MSLFQSSLGNMNPQGKEENMYRHLLHLYSHKFLKYDLEEYKLSLTQYLQDSTYTYGKPYKPFFHWLKGMSYEV